MGQRLNFEIFYDNKVIANAYYHWGAYTGVAANYVHKAIEAYNSLVDVISDPRLLAVKMLEATGAGIDDIDEMNLFKSLCPETDLKSKEYGSICISEKGIERVRKNGEEFVSLNLNEEQVFFSCVYMYTKKDYSDLCKETETEFLPYSQLPEIDVSFNCSISFDDFDAVINSIDHAENGFLQTNGLVVIPIE